MSSGIATIDSPRRVDADSCLVFIVGAFSTYDFSIIGRVMLSDIVMLLCLPLFVRHYFGLPRKRAMHGVLACATVAFLATIVSNFVVNSIPIISSVKGLAQIGSFTVSLLFWFIVLNRDFRLLKSYLFGLVPASIFNSFYVSAYDSIYIGSSSYELWLYKISPVVFSVTILLTLLCYGRSRKLAAVTLYIASMVVAVNSSRGEFAVYFVAASIVIACDLAPNITIRMHRVNAVVAAGSAMFVLSVIVYIFYLYTAPAGALGEYQRGKFEQQVKSRFGVTPWGILLSGRADSFAALDAALERPFFGFGSWSIPSETVPEFYAYLEIGMPGDTFSFMDEGAFGHSVIFGAWATSGIFAVPLWVLVLWWVGRLANFAVEADSAFTPYLLLLSLGCLFALFFNPLNASARSSIALATAASITLCNRRLEVGK